MVALPDLIARIRVDTSGLDKAVGEGARKGSLIGSAIGSGLGTLAAIGVAKIAHQFKSFIDGALDEASSLNEQVHKIGIVFGKSAEQVLAFGKTTAKSFGISEVQALKAAGTYGNLLHSVGLTNEMSSRFSTSLVKLAGDLSSFNNVPVDEVLGALQKGMVGAGKSLKQYGIYVNDGRLKQEALRLGLIHGKEALTANAKAQAAYSIIMKDSALAQGDFAKTSKTQANQHRILTAQIDDLQGKIGGLLLPKLVLLSTFATATVIPAVEKIGEALGHGKVNADGFVGNVERVLIAGKRVAEYLIGTAIPAVIHFGQELWKYKEIIIPIVAGIGAIVVAIKIYGEIMSVARTITTIFTASQAALALVMATNPFVLVALALIGLAAGFAVAWKRSETFRDVVTGSLDAVTGAVKAFANFFKGVATAIADHWKIIAASAGLAAPIWLPSMVALIAGLVRLTISASVASGSMVKAAILSARAWVVSSAQTIQIWFYLQAVAIKTAVTTAAAWVASTARMIASWVGAQVVASATAVKIAAVWVAQMAVAIASQIAAAATVIASWIAMAAVAVANAIVMAAAWLIALGPIALIIAAVIAAVIIIILQWNNIKNATLAIWGAIVAYYTFVWNLIVSVVTTYINIVKAVISAVMGAISAAISLYLNAVKAVWSTIWGAIVAVVTGYINTVKAVLSWFGGLPGMFAGWFGSAKSAAISAIAALVDFVRGIPGKVVSALGNLGGILYGAGKDLISGLLDGIKDGLKKVLDFAKDIAGKIAAVKGPKSYDLRVLSPAGRWLMEGLEAGMRARLPALLSMAAGIGDQIAGVPSMNPQGPGRSASGAGSTNTTSYAPTINLRNGATASEVMDEFSWRYGGTS